MPRKNKNETHSVQSGAVVVAFPTTPLVGLSSDRGACPRSLLERRWGRATGVAMHTEFYEKGGSRF